MEAPIITQRRAKSPPVELIDVSLIPASPVASGA